MSKEHVDPADFQVEIYSRGLEGTVPLLPTDLTQLEALFEAKVGPGPAGYVVGSAGSGRTVEANRAALDRWQIVPRMLRDVGKRDLTTDLFGYPSAAPLALAPVGVLSIVHPEAEVAAARAAAKAAIPFILSSASSTTMEEVATGTGPAERWFQLYWPRDRDVTFSFLERAQASGYSGLVVTVDTFLLAWRPRDLDQAYLPFLHGIGTANYFSDPAFQAGLAKPVQDDPAAAVRHFIGMFADPTKTWNDLAFLRENWDGPILLKGIQHPEDARQAVDTGMDAVVVSNHGGRQVNGAIGSATALPGVVEAVDGRVPVLFDGGIRSGSDMVKALALGAHSVLLGRPYAYGLGLAGQPGVEHVIRSLLADFDLTLALTGHVDPADLGPEVLWDSRAGALPFGSASGTTRPTWPRC
jgi:lactate 2-monooxygenase